MKYLLINDRVRVYDVNQTSGCVVTDTGTVMGLNGPDGIFVSHDNWVNRVEFGVEKGHWYLVKQCKKLKKKKKPRSYEAELVNRFNDHIDEHIATWQKTDPLKEKKKPTPREIWVTESALRIIDTNKRPYLASISAEKTISSDVLFREVIK